MSCSLVSFCVFVFFFFFVMCLLFYFFFFFFQAEDGIRDADVTGVQTCALPIYSTCEHHLLPIVGKAHIAYISNGAVIGLSKMNRIVDYYAKRPQVQERLTMQIVKELQQALNTQDVACVIDAKHLCVNSRGIRDIDSSTVTSEFGGAFKNPEIRREFLDYIKLETDF